MNKRKLTLRIHKEEMEEVLLRLFRKYNFSDTKAKALAEVHTESTIYGVSSHGINRVPLFIDYVNKGIVKTTSEAYKAESLGSIERWDGHQGAGVLNALTCTDRAVTLAKTHGMGLVALRNTNHWMRGGTYGWRAAEQGCIAILFTNTKPNMPAWGGEESRVGNNPLVIAIPRAKGHVVLDMSLSQFSFGKINDYRLKGEKLPYDGGWDDQNNLSKDPKEILSKERGLPIGYWKGSALSMVLDMLATLLSAGNSTYRISQETIETNISQVYLCIDPASFGDGNLQQRLSDEIIKYTHDVAPMHKGGRTYYPGERALQQKTKSIKNGMEVSEEIWGKVLRLANEN